MRLACFHRIAAGVSLLMALAGCGGAGGSSATAGGGTGGTGVSSGTITGFGSIIVNGVHFDEAPANVTINDAPSDSGDHKGLKIGMTVKVKATYDDDGIAGTASDIEAEHEVEGTIESVDPANQSFVVLGQLVYTDIQTRYEDIPGGFNDLAPGMPVEVYGLRDSSGIRATLIESADTDFDEEVRGLVSNLDLTAGTFTLDGLVVHFDDTTVFDDGSITDLVNGATVEVHFDTSSTTPNHATEIELEDNEDSEFEAEEGARVEMEGYVTRIVDSTTFEIGNQTVQTNTGTVYSGGVAADIAVGRKLEVEGTVSGGVLAAGVVEFD